MYLWSVTLTCLFTISASFVPVDSHYHPGSFPYSNMALSLCLILLYCQICYIFICYRPSTTIQLHTCCLGKIVRGRNLPLYHPLKSHNYFTYNLCGFEPVTRITCLQSEEFISCKAGLVAVDSCSVFCFCFLLVF